VLNSNSADSPPPSLTSAASEKSSAQLEKIQSKLKQGSSLAKKATSTKQDDQAQDNEPADSDEERKEAEKKKLYDFHFLTKIHTHLYKILRYLKHSTIKYELGLISFFLSQQFHQRGNQVSEAPTCPRKRRQGRCKDNEANRRNAHQRGRRE